MVRNNFILYVNKKNHLRVATLNLSYENDMFNFSYQIPEKNLVCGLIIDGKPIKGDRLKIFPFKPIEKYLFEFSNIHFVLPEMEFNEENTTVSFSLRNLPEIYPTTLFWGDAPAWNLGESNFMSFSERAQSEFQNFLYNDLFVHFSYDGLVFSKADFFSVSSQDGVTGEYFIGSGNVDFKAHILNQLGLTVLHYDLTTVPKYLYFSNNLGEQTRIFEITMP